MARSFMLSVAGRWGVDAAREMAEAQWVGSAGVAAERIAAAMGVGGGNAEALAKALQLHPCFQPHSYVDFGVELDGDTVRVSIGDCEALSEGDDYSWFAGLGAEPPPALAAIARSVDPRARCRPARRDAAPLAWEIVIDAAAEPAPEPPAVALAKLSTGARFVFTPRRPVRA